MTDDRVRLVAKNGYALVDVECYSGGRGYERPKRVRLDGRWYPVIVREYERILGMNDAAYEERFTCYAVVDSETLDGFHLELVRDHIGRFWAKNQPGTKTDRLQR